MNLAVLMMVTMLISAFWDVTPCSLVEVRSHLTETYRPLNHGVHLVPVKCQDDSRTDM